jgi:Na+-translocating ferredoxin:NAD+ oxidoreductase RnfD subunit
MSAPAIVGANTPTLRIRGTSYPVLLPTLRDPRLHLAAVIVTLQVLGQAAFAFDLSIAQILLALGTCALLEFAIAFRRQRVIMWPASALLTGNGVAFVLRVPGTQHGDWWSLHGWWIYVGTAALALLSKHVVRIRGRHVFNPSNIGLVVCFLALGKNRADPLDFWWARMSPWLALALIVIVAGGLLILSRLKLLGIAVGFWLSFAAGLGVLALSGHAMTARWHLGPVSDRYFWWVLVTSPEVLVFLFFMITDPKTIPEGAVARRVYAVSVGLLAVLLVAPQTTEFGSKVALLGALAIVCAVRPLLELAAAGRVRRLASAVGGMRRLVLAPAAVVSAAAVAGLVVVAGIPSRPEAAKAGTVPPSTAALPQVTILRSPGVQTHLSPAEGRRIARDLVADLRASAAALRARDANRATAATSGDWLAGLQARIQQAAGKPISVPEYSLERMSIQLTPGEGQGPPTIVAAVEGTVEISTYDPSNLVAAQATRRERVSQTFTLLLQQSHLAGIDRYVLTGSFGHSAKPLGGSTTPAAAVPTNRAPALVSAAVTHAVVAGFASVHLRDVARQVGLDFRQGSFSHGVTPDAPAMMGGGLCWLDYDNDGWLDLFVVNSYADNDLAYEGIPRSALFHNEHGRFVNVSASSGAGIRVRGTGCVAADFNGDGYTDLYVTTTTDDILLWNNGNGTFTEGARTAGIVSFGWHSGAAVADVNGDGRPDLFVAGYADPYALVPGSTAGFPTNHQAVCSELFLNEGNGPNGRARFREVGGEAGLPRSHCDHSLGAVFTDVNGDGRPDLYVANDEDPNRLYLNELYPGGVNADPLHLGFRFREVGHEYGVDDPNAGMGVAAADYNGDGRPDLFVSNSRGQTHAVYRSRPTAAGGPPYADARADFAPAFGTNFTGWGDSWVDLNRDGYLDLVLANGSIPVTNLARDAKPVQVLENLTGQGLAEQFGDATRLLDLENGPLLNGRGLAAADFNNSGNESIAINSIGGPLVLLENTNTAGHWLEVSLPGFHPGAVATAVLPDGRTLVREVQAGSSYLSSEDPRPFFGLGDATVVSSLTVRFPDGTVKRLENVPADRIVSVTP